MCIHSIRAHGPRPGVSWVIWYTGTAGTIHNYLGPFTTTELSMSRPCPSRSDWGSCVPPPDLGRTPPLSLLPHQVGCRAGLPPMSCHLTPVPCLAFQFLAPKLDLLRASRVPRRPPPVCLTPSYFTGPCYGYRHQSFLELEWGLVWPLGCHTVSAQLPSLDFPCPPRFCLPPAPPPL